MKVYVIKLILLITLSSCASIYFGSDLPKTNKTTVRNINKSVTFRFISVGDLSKVGNKGHYAVALVKPDNNDFYSYLKEIVPFKEVKHFKPDDDDYSLKTLKTPTKINLLFPVVFETDYFVDIYIKYPWYNHGSGTGMLGGMISGLTLGIIPMYFTSDTKYTIRILERNKKNKEVSFSESYSALAASWLWLAPSSEPLLNGNNLSSVDKNKAHYMLNMILEEIKGK